MIAAAGIVGDREIVFPEIAALACGLWVIDKPVWRIGRRQTVAMMTLAAAAGWLLARWPGLPAEGAVAIGFCFAAACQTLTRTSLPPMLSACLLPALLGAESPVYPVAVFTLTLILAVGQRLMERGGWRTPLPPVSHAPHRRDRVHGLKGFLVLMLVVAVPLRLGWNYLVLPPLIVTFVEFSRPEAGLHKAVGTIWLLLTAGALLGAGSRYLLCEQLGLSPLAAGCAACGGLFALFEWRGRIFAPAGAVALIPLLIPAADLFVYPLQAAAGAGVFLVAGRVVARRKTAAASAD